ncbi:MAG: hypothetical protein WCI02_09785 [Planctomycetota bacterium]
MGNPIPPVNSRLTPAKIRDSCIAKFDPPIAALVKASRLALRKRYPTAVELVYDNYNALAIGYGPNDRTSEAIFSLAVYPRVVHLYFLRGVELKDRNGLLEGSGNQGRFFRLASTSQLSEPQVQQLLDAAVANAKTPLPASGKGKTIIKSISAKQRSRSATAKTDSVSGQKVKRSSK